MRMAAASFLFLFTTISLHSQLAVHATRPRASVSPENLRKNNYPRSNGLEITSAAKLSRSSSSSSASSSSSSSSSSEPLRKTPPHASVSPQNLRKNNYRESNRLGRPVGNDIRSNGQQFESFRDPVDRTVSRSNNLPHPQLERPRRPVVNDIRLNGQRLQSFRKPVVRTFSLTNTLPPTQVTQLRQPRSRRSVATQTGSSSSSSSSLLSSSSSSLLSSSSSSSSSEPLSKCKDTINKPGETGGETTVAHCLVREQKANTLSTKYWSRDEYSQYNTCEKVKDGGRCIAKYVEALTCCPLTCDSCPGLPTGHGESEYDDHSVASEFIYFPQPNNADQNYNLSPTQLEQPRKAAAAQAEAEAAAEKKAAEEAAAKAAAAAARLRATIDNLPLPLELHELAETVRSMQDNGTRL